MSRIIGKDAFEVFKFAETGIVALCAEVTDLVRSGEAERRGLDVEHARFEEQKGGAYLTVAFPYLPEKDPVSKWARHQAGAEFEPTTFPEAKS